MIELPRAALTAGQIAEAAEFFSFGTNDLTQTTWGFSRDDVEASFFSAYLEKGIFGVSPFETIDRDGVGALVRIAAEEGRATRPDLKLGVCGEHGGDPESVHFFHEVGLDYVSCSPFRVPGRPAGGRPRRRRVEGQRQPLSPPGPPRARIDRAGPRVPWTALSGGRASFCCSTNLYASRRWTDPHPSTAGCHSAGHVGASRCDRPPGPAKPPTAFAERFGRTGVCLAEYRISVVMPRRKGFQLWLEKAW